MFALVLACQSGAGKTESVKIMMNMLALASRQKGNRGGSGRSTPVRELEGEVKETPAAGGGAEVRPTHLFPSVIV
jgi:myosin heavy subunit